MTVEIETIPRAPGELRCDVCGESFPEPARGRKPRTCPEHRGRPATKATKGAVRRGQPPAKMVERSTDVIGRLLIIATMIIAHRRLTHIGIHDERTEDELSLTDAEADAIAKPLARWSLRSSVGNKLLTPLVENEDLIDAGVALWEYQRRMTQTLARLQQRNASHGTVSTPRPPEPEIDGRTLLGARALT